MRYRVLETICLVATLGITPGTIAQDSVLPEVLLREGQWIGYQTGNTIQLRRLTTLSGIGGNQIGGFAAVIETKADVGTKYLSHVWGSPTGTSPGLLTTESTFSGLTQAWFSRRVAIDDVGNTMTGVRVFGAPIGFRESIWSGASVLALEGDAAPSNPGLYWRYAGSPRLSAAGVPYWIGGLTTDTDMLSRTTTSGLFFGVQGQPMLLSGAQLVGLPAPLAALDAVGPSFGIAPSGAHYAAFVRMDTGSTDDDQAIVFDGIGLTAGGTLIREAQPVDAAGALTDEVWSRLRLVTVNNAAQWALAAVTSVATDDYAVLVADGNIIHRSGDAVEDITLGSIIFSLALNADSDLVSVWAVESSSAAVLLLNDTVLVRDGDAVDFNGDGFENPSHTIMSFGPLDSVTVSDRSAGGLPTVYIHTIATLYDSNAGERYTALLRIEAHPSGLTCASIDYDGDGQITTDDFDAYMPLYQSGDLAADLNGDGAVTTLDFTVFVDLFAACI